MLWFRDKNKPQVKLCGFFSSVAATTGGCLQCRFDFGIILDFL